MARWADASLGHIALDLTAHPTPIGRRVAVRIVKALAARGAGAPTDIVTNRLYLLLEDADRGVRVEALLALLSMGDDYASQIVTRLYQGRRQRDGRRDPRGAVRSRSRGRHSRWSWR